MGDNLVKAKEFSELSSETLSSLITSEKITPAITLPILENILTQSKALNARAITRTARMTIKDISSSKPMPQTVGNLLALNKLVNQYKQGLEEIEHIEAQNQGRQAITLPANDVSSLTPTDTSSELEREKKRQKIAVETLADLKPFAKPGKEKRVIETLLKLNQKPGGFPSSQPKYGFADIMPAITNETLRQARQSEKSVSLSYGSDNISMNQDIAKLLQSTLIALCEGLIIRCIEFPLRRKNQGQSATAHIAITAHSRGSVFDIAINCQGPKPGHSLLDAIAPLSPYGVTARLSAHENKTYVSIKNIPLQTSLQSTLPQLHSLAATAEISA